MKGFYASGSYTEYGPTFRADNGWITRNNRRSLSFYSEVVKRYDDKPITLISLQLEPSRIWNTEGLKKDEALFTTLYVASRFSQLDFTFQHMISTELFSGVYYDDIWNMEFEMSIAPSQLLATGLSYSHGNQIAYGLRALGRQDKWDGWVQLRPLDRLLLEYWITHVKSREVNSDIGLFNGYVMGSRLGFQYDRRLSFRLFAQYDDFGKTWDIDPLIRYQISPFTLFYLGSTYYVQKYTDLNQAGDRFVGDGVTDRYSYYKLDSRQFFVKLQYLFQI
jgi:hypothetical protein